MTQIREFSSFKLSRSPAPAPRGGKFREMQRETHEVPVPGVRTLDHTADVGIEVDAPDLPELVRRAALGLTWLLMEREASGAMDERSLKIEAFTRATLLRDVLRELLWWHES